MDERSGWRGNCLTLANLGRNTGFQINGDGDDDDDDDDGDDDDGDSSVHTFLILEQLILSFFFRAVEQLNDFSLEGVNIKVSKTFKTFYFRKQRSLNIQVQSQQPQCMHT